jgi:4-diphosphocytidyl-2-C-methyl-D-erythritol kinase
VVRKLPDGFHEIKTTIQSIDLHDLLAIAPATETLLTTSGLRVTNAANNSVLQAHAALEQAAHRALPAHLHLHKRIPPGSGMGGASSDAAAALRGLKAIYHLEDVDLRPIAEQLGADVPYFLYGGRRRAEGRGETTTPLRMQPAWFVIAWPGFELSTADVYRAWDEVKGDGPNELRNAAENVEPRLKDFAKRLGDEWQMTGSGSAFFKTGSEAPDMDCWTVVAQATGPWD